MKIGSGYVLPLSVLTSPNFFQQDSQQVSSLQYVCAKGGQVGYNKARSVKKGRSSTFVAKMARKNMPAHVVGSPLVQIVGWTPTDWKRALEKALEVQDY